ncbi:hypothetical protein EV586_10651 [Tumebacillus sp. BK434]|uniref:hypothetical protein n=1 Tax=Tumebacillus sp. BK434 TaxID=2512169 RepID=UPI0010457BE6|nr:hypothetical protein [Tumebacillus sp. BK434]TCP53318.1 hypothetical protein EV586_10651 [Tumebacillus sp. BK434]
MDFLEYGWVIIVASGVIWNILKRIKEEAGKSEASKQQQKQRPWQEKLEELIQAATGDQQQAAPVPAAAAPSEPVPAPAAALAPEPAPEPEPVPPMSSGTPGPAAPSQRAKHLPAPASEPASAQLTSRKNLRNALILREVLSEPRAKQPWRPGGRK